MKMTRAVRYAALAAAAAVVSLVVLAVAALPAFERYFLRQEAARGEATLGLAVDGLTGAIDRFRPLPSLIAERPILVQALREPTNEGVLPYLNEQLRQTAFRIGASDVYLMDIGGQTIAASNYRKDRSFIGQNFAYRPYFTVALEGGTGQFSALGTTSGERGYFIAAPVLEGTRIVGVVAVKFVVTAFEDTWRGGDREIIVSDLNDVVFMSSRSDWHFRTLSPLSDTARAWIASTRQYPLERLVPMDMTSSRLGTGADAVTIAEDGSETQYLIQRRTIPAAGWTVSILTPTDRAFTQALWATAAVGSVILLAALVAAVIQQRRSRLRERFRAQAAARDLAEVEVTKRTAELNEANARLRHEVEERRATEERLRKTQAELVQAGKLAALGQMSAALSHEINQPLAAVKSFAGNAAAFLDRGQVDIARENIAHIDQMADRMAKISTHLRNFARRPGEKTGPVPLGRVLSDAVALMEPKLRSADADLNLSQPDREIWVRGGHLRLQQVVVNLLSNALDAMEDAPGGTIDVDVREAGGRALISVRDRGPGIPGETLEQVFDPFFTTKSPGKGLGLGLSITYNIVRDFGGSLSAENHPDGGAVFTIDLEAVDAPLSETAAE